MLDAEPGPARLGVMVTEGTLLVVSKEDWRISIGSLHQLCGLSTRRPRPGPAVEVVAPQGGASAGPGRAAGVLR